MQVELSVEDIRNLVAIISRPETKIGANEALVVAVLQQKLTAALNTPVEKDAE